MDYIDIYICVCVCVCVCQSMTSTTEESTTLAYIECLNYTSWLFSASTRNIQTTRDQEDKIRFTYILCYFSRLRDAIYQKSTERYLCDFADIGSRILLTPVAPFTNMV